LGFFCGLRRGVREEFAQNEFDTMVIIYIGGLGGGSAGGTGC
jgi:hypothetical protein